MTRLRPMILATLTTLCLFEAQATAQTREQDLLLTGPGRGSEMIPLRQVPNYRDRMREMIEDLSRYARQRDPSFAIVVRPGFELLRWDEREFFLAEAKRPTGVITPEDAITPTGEPMRRFIQSIDGVALNNQFCGTGRPQSQLQRFQDMGVPMLSVEHCGSDAAAVRALEKSSALQMASHADADSADMFERIPVRRPMMENPDNVESISDAKNMLIATANQTYGSSNDWLLAARSNNYDILVIDAFYNGNEPLSRDQVHSLKFKELGARRLVLAWLDLGFAADDRYYWDRDWRVGAPSWIVGRHDARPGTFAVEYWHPRWKSILGQYFAGIMDLGFDGVLLNGSDIYLRFEAMTPLEPL